MSPAIPSAGRPSSVFMTLLPIMSVVVVGFVIIGMAMPVLPLHVHQGLGLSTAVVGLVAGAQFAASLVSRVWAGHFSDRRGAKRAVILGLVAAAAAGLLYLVSLRFVASPALSVAVLILGRAVLGGAESFIITGALGWGLAVVDPRFTGKVIAWIGSALHVAFAGGAPVGTWLYAQDGFRAVALATCTLPLLTLLLVAPLRAIPPQEHRGGSALRTVAGAIWLPGLRLAFSCIGFGAITAFISLLFAAKGWTPAWMAFTAFAVAFILARVLFGHLPDRIGGARVALVFALVEAAGQALIWLAPGPALALVGATLTGFGFSMVYPGFGLEAVRRVPTANRALAMGGYTACLDLALGVASPLLGLIATTSGISTIFLASTVAILGGVPVAIAIMRRPFSQEIQP